MSEAFTIFFSWQSDTPRRHCRDLIRDALDIAADRVSSDPTTPYPIVIQSDTEGEPGLCNIPETILRRLRESDAVVSDLTFVAKTEADDPKHCSNPNVLFELGYAFASIGPERLICVLNENHGPAAKQIFDLAHHRRPISFTSPKTGKLRRPTIESLAAQLEEAIRAVIQLGLVGGYGGDDEILHQRHLSEIESTFQSSSPWRYDHPRIAVSFRPSLFRPKRFPDAHTLEDAVRRIGIRDAYGQFPPSQKGTAPMDWGIYNDTYGDPWALTYAAQFWAEFMVGGNQPMTLSERDAMVSPEPPLDRVLPEGGWVRANHALSQISLAFQFARNLATQFGKAEAVKASVSCRNIRGRWISFNGGDAMGPNRAPKLQREFEASCEDFSENWLHYAATIGKDFCDLFCRDGRDVSLETIKGHMTKTQNY